MAGDPDWKRFLEARLGKLGTPTLVLSSWERCLAAGLDPDAPAAARHVDGDELEKRTAANAGMLDAALPHLQWLTAALRSEPHVLCVTDADAIVLHAEGDGAMQRELELLAGAQWAEHARGTNGIGTALVAGTPAAVVGPQHFAAPLQDAGTAAAVLRGADGRISGAVAIAAAPWRVREHVVLIEYAAFGIECEIARALQDGEPVPAGRGAAASADAGGVEARRREEHFRRLVELSPDGVVVDVAGRIVYANLAAARLLGAARPADLVGRRLLELLPAEDHERFRERERRALRESVPVTEERWRRLDAVPVDIEVAAARTVWDSAPAVQWLLRDIGARKRVEQALREDARKKDRALATLSHELRHPLGPIHNAIEVLHRSAPDSDEARSALDVIERQAGQLTMLVDDLLDAVRIQAGRVALELRRVELNALLRNLVSDYRGDFARSEVELEFEASERPLEVRGDAGRLRQVVGNLLDNARKFTPRGGRVTVSLRADEERGFAAVGVRDSGVGIDRDALTRVFEPFVQADGEDRGGLGLGLALVRSIVELHGGSVTGDSDGPGSGAQFIVRLPLEDAA